MQSMHLSNNAISQATNDSISAITSETHQLSAALVATQQQLVIFTQGEPPMPVAGWPAATAAAANGIPQMSSPLPPTSMEEVEAMGVVDADGLSSHTTHSQSRLLFPPVLNQHRK